VRSVAIGIDTVENAIDAYEEKHLEPKGTLEQSRIDTVKILKVFFDAVLALRLDRLTSPRCARLYDDLIEETKLVRVKGSDPNKHGNYPMEKVPRFAAATYRNMLAQAKSFMSWAVRRKLIARDVMADVQPRGVPNRGKPQLRVNEARMWLAKAQELADAGDVGAVAAMMTLLLGVRASEIVNRLVRDIDDDCTLFVIPKTKTDAGKRTLEIPELLQPYLKKQIEGRDADAWLFPAESKSGKHWRDWPRLCVQRICDLAGLLPMTAHGMRGTQASLARAHGATAHLVAAALGHSSTRMQDQAYVRPDAAQQGVQRKAMLALVK
jgi:integrase